MQVKSLERDRINDKHRCKTLSGADYSNDPRPKTRSAYVLQTQRLDTALMTTHWSLVGSQFAGNLKKKLRQVKLKPSKVMRSHLPENTLTLGEYLRNMISKYFVTTATKNLWVSSIKEKSRMKSPDLYFTVCLK